MDTQDPNNNFSSLIYKYLSGNASDAEVQELEAWVLANSKNKEEFIAFKKAWMLSGIKVDQSKVDVEKNWKKSSEELFQDARRVELNPKPNRRIWLSIAATLAFLLIASIWFFQRNGGNSSMLVEAKDRVESIDLPDGSQVILNQASVLSFSIDEEEAKRKIDLKGDAFFEVKRDEGRPFIIKTQDVEIEVLGTSFYVDGREDEAKVVVVVQSGSVSVRYGSEERILKANEKAVFQKETKLLTKSQNQDPNYKSIQTNTLIFEKTKLDEVASTLSRHFNKKVTIENEAIKKCELNAVFENKSLDTISKILEETLKGIKVNRVGDKVILKGLSCD